MKKRFVFLILILVFVLFLAFAMSKISNWNFQRLYQTSYTNTFFSMSLIIEDYLLEEEELEKLKLIELEKTGIKIVKDRKTVDNTLLSDEIQGIWVFGKNTKKGITKYQEKESEVLNFYEQNLKGSKSYTLIILENKPLLLANFPMDSIDILLLAKAEIMSQSNLNRLLDFIIQNSELLYYSILDENQKPIIYSSFYEEFLPIMGKGAHSIDTPNGKILQLEDNIGDKLFVAGFSMAPLQRIISLNNRFLIGIILIFVILEALILFNLIRFESFRLKKAKEISLLKEFGAISSGFSHEFKNSLHTLSLLARDLNQEQRNILTSETNRMNTVMNSFKLLAQTEIKKERLNLTEVIDESIALNQNMLDMIKIEKEIVAGAWVYGNRTLLLTAFSNLIKNSIEANARNIRISGQKKGADMMLSFIDDGKGIDEKIIDKVFEPFFTQKGQTGLGLYLVKKIIESHDGKIELEQADKKTIFKITLK
ncbi:MAG: HAMP domain-containing histidine kinase [candidate division WOR-3 bacterium]|nr:HAMP domain-containing histidine kinase [candidate division WOR-3 bacterium]